MIPVAAVIVFYTMGNQLQKAVCPGWILAIVKPLLPMSELTRRVLNRFAFASPPFRAIVLEGLISQRHTDAGRFVDY